MLGKSYILPQKYYENLAQNELSPYSLFLTTVSLPLTKMGEKNFG
jgi:hypothetical protein